MNGCDGFGASCNNANCGNTNAFYGSTDYGALRGCSADNVRFFYLFLILMC